MRCIAHLDTEEAAEMLCDFLYVEGIPAHVEADSATAWALWVEDEDQLALAGEWLAKFRANPRDPVFKTKAREAAALRAQAQKTDAAYAKKLKDRREAFRPMLLAGTGPLTLLLIVICVGLAVLRLSPAGIVETKAYLSFSLPEILDWQVWRLLTPIFMHAPLFGGWGFMHLLFNVLWLRDLGGMIESRQGTAQLALLVLVLGVGSSAVQYFAGPLLLQLANAGGPPAAAQLLSLVGNALGGGPDFYGMSGVNYGLFGYLWLRSRFDPGSGLFLHPQTVSMMLIWFVLCFTPIFSNIANGAHLGGLVIGTAWGWLSSQRYR